MKNLLNMSSAPKQEQSAQIKIIQIYQDNLESHKSILDKIGDKIGRQNAAYIIMTFACLIYPVGFLYPNQNNFNVCETFLIRAIALIGINLLIALYFQMDLTYQNPHNFKILLLRSACVTIQGIGYTLCQFYLSQPVVQTLNATGPLFIIVLDYLINKIIISKKQIIGVMIGVTGVLLTVNGQFLVKYIDSGYSNKSDFKNYASDNPIIKLLLALFFVFGNVLWAYAQVITKRLNGMHSIQINIHLGIFFLFTTGLVYPTQVIAPVPIQKIIISIFLGGLVSTIGQVTFVIAASMTKNTGALTMFVFVGVIQGYLVSIFMYHQAVNPVCTIGAVLIVFGLSRIVLKDNLQKQKKKSIQATSLPEN